MSIKVFNTLSRKKEEFKPIHDNEVRMYVCGPTIYDHGHLGHGRSAINFDIIRRYFLYKGYKVKFIFNYTDIDDKMINRAKEKGITVKALADQMAKVYNEDYAKIGVLKPDVNPYATQYIHEMIEIIKKMEKNEFTYVINEDGVYYDLSKFEEYGKLSGVNLEKQMGVRLESKDQKRNHQDFVLWKFKKEGEPSWESPWGEGRPGWHLECTAMIWKNIGIPFDIHGGGADLIMPHHEGEIAQGYAAFGEGYAKYWMHNGFINVDNEKMSKSLGNFFTMNDIFKKYDPKVVRYFVLQVHYRAPVNFADTLLDQAKNSLDRINNFVERLHDAKGEHTDINRIVEKAKNEFESCMDDDFEISGALASLFEFVREINQLVDNGKIDEQNKNEILIFLKKINSVLNVIDLEQKTYDVGSEVEELISKREEARKSKDWKEADRIRDELKAKGITLLDTPQGVKRKKE